MTDEGPHRKRIKHYHEPGDFHELTFSCYHRIPLLTNDSWRAILARSIDEACKECQFELAAFVFMPEHVHLLVFPLPPKPDIGFFLARIKQPVSTQVGVELKQSGSRLLSKLTVQERPGKVCFRFWQEGPGYDRNLFKLRAIENSIDYIHQNPVKRKLCKQAVEWIWSSARFYLLDPPSQQLPGLPTIHGLRPEVYDRDDFR